MKYLKHNIWNSMVFKSCKLFVCKLLILLFGYCISYTSIYHDSKEPNVEEVVESSGHEDFEDTSLDTEDVNEDLDATSPFDGVVLPLFLGAKKAYAYYCKFTNIHWHKIVIPPPEL